MTIALSSDGSVDVSTFEVVVAQDRVYVRGDVMTPEYFDMLTSEETRELGRLIFDFLTETGKWK